MKTLATKSKQKKTLLIIMTVFFAILTLLYLYSFLKNHITSSMTYFILMGAFTLFCGVQLMAFAANPEVLAEYNKENLYLHMKKGDIVIPLEQLDRAKRKGHKNRVGNVQYGEIVFFTIDQKEYVLKDVGNPDDVIIQIRSILNKMEAKPSNE